MPSPAFPRLKHLLAALSVAVLASTGMGYVTTAQAEDHSSGSHSSGGGGKGGSGSEGSHKEGGSSGGGSKSLEGKVFHSGGASDEHGSGKGKGKGPKYKGGKSGESSPDEGHSHDK